MRMSGSLMCIFQALSFIIRDSAQKMKIVNFKF